jgi:hypothetical protein
MRFNTLTLVTHLLAATTFTMPTENARAVPEV